MEPAADPTGLLLIRPDLPFRTSLFRGLLLEGMPFFLIMISCLTLMVSFGLCLITPSWGLLFVAARAIISAYEPFLGGLDLAGAVVGEAEVGEGEEGLD